MTLVSEVIKIGNQNKMLVASFLGFIVESVANRKGKISYSDALKTLHSTICKLILSKQPPLTLNWDFKPVLDFVVTDTYKTDYNLFGTTALEPDNFIVLKGCDY